jgi:predicted Zn-dependent protease
MFRPILVSVLTSSLWLVMPCAQAIPLSQSQTLNGLGLAKQQWGDSSVLTEAVNLLKQGDPAKAKTRLAQFLKEYPNDPRGPELAGMILMEEKNYKVAVVSFERSLKLKPNNAAVLAKLGVSYLLLDKEKEGEERLNRAVALVKGEPLARRYLGWLEEKRGNLKEASQHYVVALKEGGLQPGIATEIHIALGKIYGETGRDDELVRLMAPLVTKSSTGLLDQAARFQLAYAYMRLNRMEADPLIHSLEHVLKPDNPEMRFLMANAKFGADPGGARDMLKALVQAHPSYSGRAGLLIARSYAVQGKTAQAVSELEALAGRADRNQLPGVLTALAAVHISSGKPAEAAKAMEVYSKKYPDISAVTYLLAETKLQSNDIAGAQALLQQLIAKNPQDAQAYALLGQVERAQKAFTQAEDHLKKAVLLNSGSINSWVNLAGVHVARKELPKAEAALKQALEANPGNGQLQYELAGIFEASGKAKEANQMYKTILGVNPNYLPALSSIAINFAENNDLVSAKQYLEKANKINKLDPVVLDANGWVLVLGKEVDKGIVLLQDAAKKMPDDSMVMYHLGAALVSAGKAEDGKRYLQRSLAAGPPDNLREKAQALVK